jgi:hypothetical protein
MELYETHFCISTGNCYVNVIFFIAGVLEKIFFYNLTYKTHVKMASPIVTLPGMMTLKF